MFPCLEEPGPEMEQGYTVGMHAYSLLWYIKQDGGEQDGGSGMEGG